MNAGEIENLVTDQLEAIQQREYRDTRDFSGYRNKFETKISDLRQNVQNKANRCFCTTTLFKSQDWHFTGHGSHTPLQNDGDEPMMDLAQNLQIVGVHALADFQTWYVRTQTLYEHVAASSCEDEEVLTVAQRLSCYSDFFPETGTGTETDSCQRS